MQLREEKGLFQKNIAAYLDLSVNAYNSIENGKTNITINNLFKIAEILEVSVSSLLGLKEDENNYINNSNFVISQNNQGTLYFQVSDQQLDKIITEKTKSKKS